MHALQRLSVWGLIAGWLFVAIATKTIRGDGAGLWVRLDLTLAIGIGIVLISSIGVGLASFSRRVSAVQPRAPSQQDAEHLG